MLKKGFLLYSLVLPCLLIGCVPVHTTTQEQPQERIVGDARVLRETGAAYISTGEYDKAISKLDKALQINPKYAEAYSNRADAYLRMGQNGKAIADLNAALQINPRHTQAYSNRATAYLREGLSMPGGRNMPEGHEDYYLR